MLYLCCRAKRKRKHRFTMKKTMFSASQNDVIQSPCHPEERSDEGSENINVAAYRSFTTLRMTRGDKREI